jgi:hypothetical protein
MNLLVVTAVTLLEAQSVVVVLQAKEEIEKVGVMMTEVQASNLNPPHEMEVTETVSLARIMFQNQMTILARRSSNQAILTNRRHLHPKLIIHLIKIVVQYLLNHVHVL